MLGSKPIQTFLFTQYKMRKIQTLLLNPSLIANIK